MGDGLCLLQRRFCLQGLMKNYILSLQRFKKKWKICKILFPINHPKKGFYGEVTKEKIIIIKIQNHVIFLFKKIEEK